MESAQQGGRRDQTARKQLARNMGRARQLWQNSKFKEEEENAINAA